MELGQRSLIALTAGAVATYAARQSSRHRTAELDARRVELDLAAIEPFLAGIPRTEHDAVVIFLARRLFGRDKVSVGEADDSAGFAQLLETIRSLPRP